MLNTPKLAAIRSKIEARIDRLEERLDDPKEMERMMQNPLAYVLFFIVYTLPITLIVDAVQNHRFAWWAIPMGFFMWCMAKALYIPSEKKVLPTAEQVRAKLIQYKNDAERKLDAAKASLATTAKKETVKA